MDIETSSLGLPAACSLEERWAQVIVYLKGDCSVKTNKARGRFGSRNAEVRTGKFFERRALLSHPARALQSRTLHRLSDLDFDGRSQDVVFRPCLVQAGYPVTNHLHEAVRFFHEGEMATVLQKDQV